MFTDPKSISSGFGLIGLIIAVAIIGLLSGGGLYWNETQKQQSLLELGRQKEKEAEALKQKIFQQQVERLDQVGEYLGSKPTPRPTPQSIPQPTNIDTSNWKVYRNEKYGFEFKYPGEFTFKEHSGQGFTLKGQTSKEVSFSSPRGPNAPRLPANYPGDIVVSIRGNPYINSIESFYEKGQEDFNTMLRALVFVGGRKEVSMGDIKGVEYKGMVVFGYSKLIVIQNKDYFIEFYQRAGKSDIEEIFNTMIKSLVL